MDLRLDAIGGEECLQFIATLAENGEDMVYGVARFNRIPSRIFAAAESYFHEVVAYFPLITGCNLLAAQVVGIEMPQFYAEREHISDDCRNCPRHG